MSKPFSFSYSRSLSLLICMGAAIFTPSLCPAAILESDTADYSGNEIILSGHVKIENEMGSMAADLVELQRMHNDDFQHAKLSGNVSISLKDGSLLKCTEAHISAASGTPTIDLTGSIRFIYQGKIDLQSDQRVVITFVKNHAKYDLMTLESIGKTFLSYHDNTSTITCFGKVLLDNTKKQILLESPLINGRVRKEEQIHLCDPMGKIQGDEAQIDFSIDEKKIFARKIAVNGCVQLNQLQIQDKKEHPALSGYALADTAAYFPLTRELSLLAHTGHCVTFFETVRKSKLTASAIHIKRHPVTGKEIIHGEGNVRLIHSP